MVRNEQFIRPCFKRHLDSIIGNRYGMLTVIGIGEPVYSKKGYKTNTALCQCDCGKTKSYPLHALEIGQATSCGCNRFGKQKKHNYYEIDGDFVRVFITSSDVPMLCDVDVWNKTKSHCWGLGSHGYAYSRINDKLRIFHSLLTDIGENLVIDHINRNRLDNRLSNLRIVPQSVNVANRNYKNKTGIKYCYKNGKGYSFKKDKKYLGTVASREEAIEISKQLCLETEKIFNSYHTLADDKNNLKIFAGANHENTGN